MARDEEEGQDVSERMNKDEDAQKPKWRTDCRKDNGTRLNKGRSEKKDGEPKP